MVKHNFSFVVAAFQPRDQRYSHPVYRGWSRQVGMQAKGAPTREICEKITLVRDTGIIKVYQNLFQILLLHEFVGRIPRQFRCIGQSLLMHSDSADSRHHRLFEHRAENSTSLAHCNRVLAHAVWSLECYGLPKLSPSYFPERRKPASDQLIKMVAQGVESRVYRIPLF